MARPSAVERAGPTAATMGARSCPAQGAGSVVLGPWAGWGGEGGQAGLAGLLGPLGPRQ